METEVKPRYQFSIRGDFLGTSSDREFETNTLRVAGELKRQVRKNEWNHRVKLEAINRYSPSENGVEIIVLPNVIQYCQITPDDVAKILDKHLVEDSLNPTNTTDRRPISS